MSPAVRPVAARPQDEAPVRVASVIARLLHSFPPPANPYDPAALATWLADRAELCDRIADAAADPGLAAHAAAVAAAARDALAGLTHPIRPTASTLPTALPGGAA